MSSTFTGISTALNALMAHRQSIDVAGQNVANANTPGYTRQRADLTAVSATGHAGIYTQVDAPGWGVQVTSVTRIVDGFVDARQRDAHGSLFYAEAGQTAMSGIEQIVNEPSDTGLSSQLSEFWSSWQDVANHPDDVSARSQLLSQAGTLVDTITQGRSAIGDEFTNTRNQLSAVVDQVNSTATSVADLNDRIRLAKATGSQVNEMSDQRDQLVLQLSQLTGATAVTHDDGTTDVVIGSTPLVSGVRAASLVVSGGATLDSVGTTPVKLEFSDGRSAAISSGSAGGLMAAMNSTYPSAATGYDTVAQSLISGVNALHSTGKDLDGNAATDFFAGTDARTLSVAVNDPRAVAAAGGANGALDGSLADTISALGTSTTGPDATWRSYVAQLGVESQSATRRLTLQDTVARQADASRDSTSGVSVDEEMTNLLMFQRAYEGAARVLTAVDQTLDTLINRTGLVGR